jgi:hypothetical protein
VKLGCQGQQLFFNKNMTNIGGAPPENPAVHHLGPGGAPPAVAVHRRSGLNF